MKPQRAVQNLMYSWKKICCFEKITQSGNTTTVVKPTWVNIPSGLLDLAAYLFNVNFVIKVCDEKLIGVIQSPTLRGLE